jgi:carboxypeptidase D
MRFFAVVSALAVLVNVTSAAHHSVRSLKHVGMADKHHPKHGRREPQQQKPPRSDSSQYLTNSTASKYIHTVRIHRLIRFIEYFVNGTAIPDVDFDIGESYGGLMPTSKTSNDSQLYFWFFPSENPDAGDEIMIWLNGGVS